MRAVLVLLVCAVLPWSVIGSLTYLDPNIIKETLTVMWQKTLNTNSDPADGKWYTNGANNDGAGLYGNLTDRIDTTVNYDPKGVSFTRTQFTADSATVDNRNGLNPTNTVKLSYTHTSKTSQTHTVSKSFSHSFNATLKASFTVFGIGGDLTTSYAFNYDYSFIETDSSTTSDSITTSQTVPVTVPKGKVYKAILTASQQQMIVPTSVLTHITGTSETWFSSKINGHYNWINTAAETCESIKKYGSSPVGDSSTYGADPTNGQAGVITTTGSIMGANVANFVANVVDVTGLTEAQIEAYERDMSFPSALVVERIRW